MSQANSVCKKERKGETMHNYGDITKIDGCLVEPVDIVTGGSPCQNFSTTGNREGLRGEKILVVL